jgi:hypothetical protein
MFAIIGVLLRLSQHHRDGAHRAPDVFIARLPVADTYPHRPHATPGSRREERFAGCRDGGDYVIGPVVMYRTFATSTLSTNSSGSKLTPFGYNLGGRRAKIFEETSPLHLFGKERTPCRIGSVLLRFFLVS